MRFEPLAVLAAPAIAASGAMAQPLFKGETKKGMLGIEYFRPEYSDSHFSNYALFFDFWIRMSSRAVFVADLPFASYSQSEYFEFNPAHHEDALGNVYAGVEMGRQGPGAYGEIGLRLPMAPSGHGYDALFSGMISDINRLESFYPDLLTTFSGAFGYDGVASDGISPHFRIGPALMLTDPDHYYHSAKLALHYNGSFWYDGKIGGFGAGFSGASMLTEGGLFSQGGDETAVQIDIGGNLKLGKIGAGLQFGFPVNGDLDRLSKYILALNFVADIE